MVVMHATDSRAAVPLHNFLGSCRHDWGARELDAVRHKLAVIGIFNTDKLLEHLKSGSLNDHLDAAGEKRFTAETLDTMGILGAQLSASLFSMPATLGNPYMAPGDRCSYPRTQNFLNEADLEGERDPGISLPRNYQCSSKHSPVARVRIQPLNSARVAANVETNEFHNKDTNGEDMRGFPVVSKTRSSTGKWAASRRHQRDFDDPFTLSWQICKDLAHVEKTANEAKRRNREVAQSLAEVQADIDRVSDKMCAARRKRQGIQHREDMPDNVRVASHEVPVRESNKPGIHTKVNERVRRPVPRPASSLFQSGIRTSRTTKEVPCARATSSRCSPSDNEARSAPHQQPEPPCQRTNNYMEHSGVIFELQEAIKEQLLSMYGCSEAERRSFLKRLLVKWHPDRNPENVETATAVFQYIQQEKGRLLGI